MILLFQNNLQFLLLLVDFYNILCFFSRPYLFEGTTIKVLDRRSSDGSVLYEMELYPGEYLVLGQKNDMEENADIREDNGEIKQEGMNMTL